MMTTMEKLTLLSCLKTMRCWRTCWIRVGFAEIVLLMRFIAWFARRKGHTMGLNTRRTRRENQRRKIRTKKRYLRIQERRTMLLNAQLLIVRNTSIRIVSMAMLKKSCLSTSKSGHYTLGVLCTIVIHATTVVIQWVSFNVLVVPRLFTPNVWTRRRLSNYRKNSSFVSRISKIKNSSRRSQRDSFKPHRIRWKNT